MITLREVTCGVCMRIICTTNERVLAANKNNRTSAKMKQWHQFSSWQDIPSRSKIMKLECISKLTLSNNDLINHDCFCECAIYNQLEWLPSRGQSRNFYVKVHVHSHEGLVIGLYYFFWVGNRPLKDLEKWHEALENLKNRVSVQWLSSLLHEKKINQERISFFCGPWRGFERTTLNDGKEIDWITRCLNDQGFSVFSEKYAWLFSYLGARFWL